VSRDELNARSHAAPDLPEARHFHLCAECGQAVDRRNLGDVFHHETPGHVPLATSDGAVPTAGKPLGFVEPMQAALATEAPDGDGWIHELKYDGYRTQIILDWSARYAFTRRGFDWSELYEDLLEEARYLDCTSAVLDGEVIVQDQNGLPDFHRLQKELRGRRPQGLVFMAFDLLHLDGRDLRDERLEDRRSYCRCRGL
jgi:ATP-dependent DNA ligase